MRAVPLSTALGIKYSAHFIGTLHGCCTRFRQLFFVFDNAFFGCFQVHGPTSLPLMCFAGKAVKDVACISVLQTADFVPLKLDRFKDFRLGAFILKLLHDEESRVELTYKA